MRIVDIIYKGTLVIEEKKIFLKDIAMKSNFNNLSNEFSDCSTEYNIFPLSENLQIIILEEKKEIEGTLFWDNDLKEWFLYNIEEKKYEAIKTGVLAVFKLELPLSNESEWQLTTRKATNQENGIFELARIFKPN